MNTLFRIISAVFSGEEFQSNHDKVVIEEIFEKLKEIPYQLSIEQKKAVINALTNDVSYIQGPPGTGKSFTISTLSLVASSLGQRVLEVGAFYWTASAPVIVNPGREEQGLVSV
jgi:signal recognition particle GTPase